jgi:hypothetical protein
MKNWDSSLSIYPNKEEASTSRFWFFIIICMNLREFEQAVVRDYLWNSFDQIKIKLSNHLSSQMGLISDFSQSLVQFFSNSNK